MTKNYKILGKYIKDVSGETPDIETYIFVKDQIYFQIGDCRAYRIYSKLYVSCEFIYLINNEPETSADLFLILSG